MTTCHRRGRGVVAGLVLGALLSPAAVLAATRHVPGEYASIQAAVDDAGAGDVIAIAAGVYEEQVVITADVTLAGVGAGSTTVRAPEYMPYTAHVLAYNAVIHVEPPATLVTIRDLTVDGAGRGRPDTRFTGIMYDRVGGLCEAVEITSVSDTPASSAISGIGLYAYSDTQDDLDFTARDVLIHDFQKAGFVCFGAGADHLLERVTADAGAYADAVQNGFELLLGTRGRLVDCVARGCWYDGTPLPDVTACGYILYYGDPWSLEGCVADGNQTAIFAMATDLAVTNATVDVLATPLAFNNGLAISTSQFVTKSGGGPDLGLPRVVQAGDLDASFPEADHVFELRDSIVRGADLVGSSGLTCFSNFNRLQAEIHGSEFTGWDHALRMIELGTGRVRGQARSCRIQDSGSFAGFTFTSAPFDARGNDWGDPSGPNHPVTNPGGLGGTVSDNVVFAPWLTGNVVVSPLMQTIAQDDADAGGYSDEVTVRYIGGLADLLYGYSVELTWDHDLLTADAIDVQRPEAGAFADASLFQVLPVAGGLRVDAAIGGGHDGIPRGDLLRLRLHLTGAPDYLTVPVALRVLHARDRHNHEIAGLQAMDGVVVGDVQAPVVTALALDNQTLAHTDAYAKHGDLLGLTAAVTDGDPLFGVAYMWGDLIQVLGGPGWQLMPDQYADGVATWLGREASLFPPDGPVPFGITVFDPSGNHATAVGSVIADNTPPASVTGFTASPGHNQVHLAWDDPASLDANLRHVVVRAAPWGDYPLYVGDGPSYPAGPGQGLPAFTGLADGAVVTFAPDGSERDILHLRAFAVDMVDLVSAPADGDHDRCTNYWLGDISEGGGPMYDGVVDIWDVTQLGDTFGLATGEPGFDAECDVGPTEDGGVVSIPLPDRVIDFDDLMIFSIQFESFLPDIPPPAPAPLVLRWAQESDLVWTLELVEPCPALKGLRLASPELPPGVAASVTAGALLAAQPSPHFLRAAPSGLDASLAVLGRGAGVTGSGPLLRVALSAPVAGLPVEVVARDVVNADLPTSLASPTAAAGDAPLAFSLRGARPNPFNPATVVAFDLPAREDVRLVVYSLDGRRVATLVDAPLPAGRHQVDWRAVDDAGRRVAAGTYVLRLEAGRHAATGKLNLVK